MLRSAFGSLTSVMSSSFRAATRRRLLHSWQTASESLETRVLMSATNPLDDIVVSTDYSTSTITPHATSGPTGYSPAQIRHAYGFDSVSFANGTVAGDGAGTTIAIVDAYDDPNIASDLHQFDLQFGLPDPVLTKVNQNGGSTLPTADKGWAGEITLDVEWAHAIAPKAKILLVEANDPSLSNLMSAVDYARHATGVNTVSMSWGSSEFSGEKSYDSYFTTPAGHTGVTFVASSGDDGAPVEFPAISPNVVGAGGTALNLGTSNNYVSESGWTGSGGGISAYQSQPSYQKGVVTQTSTRATSPDVAFDSDPNTGFSVYDSYGNGSSRPWSQVGGTSAAAPQWAALLAIVDQGRSLSGLSSLDGATQTLSKIYSLPSSDFHDVTTGKSTGSPSYSAGPGYDLVTGRGSPVANLLIQDLVGTTTTTPPTTPGATHFSISTTASTTAGGSFTVTVTALDSSNHVVTGYTGNVHFSSTDTNGVLPANYTFTTTDKGVHTFAVSLRTAGTQTLNVTDTSNGSLFGSSVLTVNPGAASRLVFLQQPSTVAPNTPISPAVKVEVLDAYNNVVTTDNSDVVTIALASNPGSALLSGTLSATVSGGVATFGNLSLNKAGNGYTLSAKSGALTAATSSSFNVVTVIPTAHVVEGFEDGFLWDYYRVGGSRATVSLSSYYGHDGFYGLQDTSGSDWIYRNDSTTHVKQGDTISVWVGFLGNATGQASFGFGATSAGTLSVTASPGTNQLLLSSNLGYGSTTLATANQTWQPDHWYRLEVDWGTSGKITAKVFDSDGTTQLGTVTATTSAITSGGIAFKSTGVTTIWDTVQVTPGANSFSLPAGINLGGNGASITSPLGAVSVNTTGTTNLPPIAIATNGSSSTTLDQIFSEGIDHTGSDSPYSKPEKAHRKHNKKHS